MDGCILAWKGGILAWMGGILAWIGGILDWMDDILAWMVWYTSLDGYHTYILKYLVAIVAIFLWLYSRHFLLKWKSDIYPQK